LINRTFEVGLAEMAIREKTGLLAYSPLGAGMLTGKYLQDTPPADGRLVLFPQFKRYSSPFAIDSTRKYAELARANGLSPAQMALAFVNSRDFLTSNIIGATKMEQLKENIDTINIELSDELLENIEEIHLAQPNPSP